MIDIRMKVCICINRVTQQSMWDSVKWNTQQGFWWGPLNHPERRHSNLKWCVFVDGGSVGVHLFFLYSLCVRAFAAVYICVRLCFIAYAASLVFGHSGGHSSSSAENECKGFHQYKFPLPLPVSALIQKLLKLRRRWDWTEGAGKVSWVQATGNLKSLDKKQRGGL